MKIQLLFSALSLGLSLSAHAADFAVSNRDISDDKPLSHREVFQGFGCEGGDTSPELSWKDAAAGTMSFAVTVYDPDAPHWQWLVALDGGQSSRHYPAGAINGEHLSKVRDLPQEPVVRR